MKNIKLIVKAFGTICEVLVEVREEDEIPARKTIKYIKDYLIDIDDRISVFKSGSEISRINNYGLNEAIKVSADTFEILKIAKHYAADTNGIFDVTIGKSTDQWRRKQSNLKYTIVADCKGLILDDMTSTARLSMPNLAVDLGGIAKGYAVDKIRKILLSNGIGTATINFGGTVSIIGKEKIVGFRNPFIPMNRTGIEVAFGSMICRDEVIVTSGIYEQSREKENNSHHIINPQTGMPCETDLLSAIVISKSGVVADIYATTLIVLGLKDSIAFSYKKNLSVILVNREGKVYVSESLRNLFTLKTEVSR